MDPGEVTSGLGTSLHFACAQHPGRVQIEAGIKWQAGSAATGENEPERTFGPHLLSFGNGFRGAIFAYGAPVRISHGA